MANDKTFGVRLSDEQFDKVKAIIDNSGLSTKEWFEKAVALTETQSLKEGATEYSKDLTELEIHTARIYELISNMVQRSIYIKDNAVKEVADKLQQRESIIGEYQEKARVAGEESKAIKESLAVLKQEKEELSKQLEGQLATLENNQSLIDEYKEKIDTLSSLVNQYKGYAAQNTELKESFAAEKESMATAFNEREGRLLSAMEELKATTVDQQNNIERLTNNLNSTIAANEKEMESIHVNHTNELTQLTKEKDLEKEKAILEVKQEYQEKVQTVHDQYNEKLAALYAKFEANSPNKKETMNKQKDR